MTLSCEEMFERNLELTRRRLLKEIEAPEAFEWIPQNARIINLPKDAPELLKANLELAMKLAGEKDARPIVLIPEPGFEMPWQELVPLVSGKRIVGLESSQVGASFDLIFDDGSRLMLFAMKQLDDNGSEQRIISYKNAQCSRRIAVIQSPISKSPCLLVVAGRSITVPLAWYPQLLHATPEQRENWTITGEGRGIHWPDIDAGLSIEELLRGISAPGVPVKA